MDEILELAKEIRQDIDSLPEVQEYYRLKSLLENDSSLKKLRKEIAKAKLNNEEEKWNELLSAYNSHPIINNYEIAKQEVKSLLLSIKNIIN